MAMHSGRPRLLWPFLLLLLTCLILGFGLSLNSFTRIPEQAAVLYGPPAENLSALQRFRLAFSLLQNQPLLLEPVNPAAGEVAFTIGVAESTASIIANLEAAGLIHNRDAFRDFLIYSGLDTQILSLIHI
mgnify:FL=1